MTILGYHTAAELADLLGAFDAEVTALGRARDQAAADDSWANADPSGWAQWLTDEATFENAYHAAAQHAHQVASSETGLGSDAAYGALLEAMQNGSTPSPGGFDDLNRRFLASPASAAAKALLDAGDANVPQPTAPDTDLNIIDNPTVKAAADAGQAIVKGAGKAAGGFGGALAFIAQHPLLVGGTVVGVGGALLLIALGAGRRAAPLAL